MKELNNLFTATKIKKINNKYFINDCWHHRIIYNDNLKDDIYKWNTIDYKFSGCHTIASDGSIYVVDNTGMNEVIILDSDLKFIQKFINIGNRPHHVIYDEVTKKFYVVTANSQEIYCFKNNNGVVEQCYSKKLDFLGYTRSITIIDGYMYFASADGHIYKTTYIDGSYSIVNAYNIPREFGGINQVYKINDYYYVTIVGDINFSIDPRMLRTKDLSTIENNVYEDIYNTIGFTGEPYFITEFDGGVYITEIGNAIAGIYSFEVDIDNNIKNINKKYKFTINEKDFKIKNIFPL